MTTLIVDDLPIPPCEMHRYALRWHDGDKLTLYLDGKRITKAWRIMIDATVPADTRGGNANTY